MTSASKVASVTSTGDCSYEATTSAAQPATSASGRPRVDERSERCPRSISISGRLSSPSELAPTSPPNACSSSVEKTPRRPVRGRAIPSSSRSSSNGSIRTFESEPMQMGMRARADALGGQEAVAEVGLRRRAGADRRAVRGEEVELGAVGVRRVHDRRALAQAAGPREELDRPAAVLGEALLDLLRLLVGVDVEREAARAAYRPISSSQSAGQAGRSGGRARPRSPRRAARRPGEILADGLLAEAGETSARVGDVEEDEGDAGIAPHPRRPRASGTPR